MGAPLRNNRGTNNSNIFVRIYTRDVVYYLSIYVMGLCIVVVVDKYPLNDEIEYNINMEDIHRIKSPLTKLDNMIGMDNIKNSIIDQILYYMQNLHS